MNSSPKAYDWTRLGMEAQNCFLNHSKPTTWAHQRCIRMINIKGQKLTRCMPSKCKPKPFHHNQGSSHFKQILKDHNQDSSFPSANPSHFKQIPKDHKEGSNPPSLKHPQWTKKKQVAQLCLTPHLVATSWLRLKFVCLFHVSMFLWILKIHVAFDVLCSCIYFKKKKIKKNFKISKSFQKKRKFFKWKKVFGLGALSP